MKRFPFRRDWRWLAAAVGAFALGLWVSPQIMQKAPTIAGGAGTESAKAPSPLRTTQLRKSGADGAPGSATAWAATYESFHRTQDNVERQRLLAAALGAVTKENWEAAWDQTWDSRRFGQISDAECKLFLRRFGEVAGPEIAARSRPADVVKDWETRSSRYAMAGWAAKDPDGCWACLSALPEGNYRRGLMWGWFEAVSGIQPDRALEAAQRLDLDLDPQIWATVATKVAAHDPAKMRVWLEELTAKAAAPPDPEGGRPAEGTKDGVHDSGPASGAERAKLFFNQMLRERLTMSWSSEYVQNLKDWYDVYDGSPAAPTEAMGEIASALQRSQSAPVVLEWIAKHPVSPDVYHAAANTVSRWTNEKSADDVAGWLLANKDSPAYDGAAAGFAAKAKPFDPEGARAWAQTVKDENQRDQILRYLDEPAGK